jgi:adenosylcobyric acid synthase
MRQRIVIFDLPFRGPTDEFLPLRSNPCWEVNWVKPQEFDGDARVIILPGSGRTVLDLAYLRQMGGAEKIRHHLSQGGIVVGVCGGFQILGQRLLDPLLGQGEEKEACGLGFLPITSMFGPQMLSTQTTATLLVGAGAGGQITGEERRSGYSWLNMRPSATAFQAMSKIDQRSFHEAMPRSRVLKETAILWAPGREKFDGLVSPDRQVWGSYLHLIFHSEAFRHSLFRRLAHL